MWVIQDNITFHYRYCFFNHICYTVCIAKSILWNNTEPNLFTLPTKANNRAKSKRHHERCKHYYIINFVGKTPRRHRYSSTHNWHTDLDNQIVVRPLSTHWKSSRDHCIVDHFNPAPCPKLPASNFAFTMRLTCPSCGREYIQLPVPTTLYLLWNLMNVIISTGPKVRHTAASTS